MVERDAAREGGKLSLIWALRGRKRQELPQEVGLAES